jgi:proteasome lid subunit RPN8/RPN11
VTARNQEDDLNARIVEAVSNYYWRRFDFHAEMKLIVKDFVFFGLGVAKATWLLKEEDRELTREEWVTQVQAALMEAQQARMNPEVASLGMVFPTEEEIISGISTTGTFAVEDRPNVERISPFDIYIDPDATRFENARWVAQRMYMPLEEAKERDDWSAAARKRLKGAAMSSAKKDYDLIAVFHSHVAGDESPSEFDIKMSESCCLSFIIYSINTNKFHVYEPKNKDYDVKTLERIKAKLK